MSYLSEMQKSMPAGVGMSRWVAPGSACPCGCGKKARNCPNRIPQQGGNMPTYLFKIRHDRRDFAQILDEIPISTDKGIDEARFMAVRAALNRLFGILGTKRVLSMRLEEHNDVKVHLSDGTIWFALEVHTTSGEYPVGASFGYRMGDDV